MDFNLQISYIYLFLQSVNPVLNIGSSIQLSIASTLQSINSAQPEIH